VLAKELSDQAGRHRVSAQTTEKKIDIDLQGKAHLDKATGNKIDTPHVHEAKLNVGPNGKVNTSEQITRPATKDDIRTARKLLEKESNEQ
jgi:hypothetical protein